MHPNLNFSWFPSTQLFSYLFIYSFTYLFTGSGACVEVRGQVVGGSSPLPPCRFQGLNSDCQQAALPTESSFSPAFKKCTQKYS